jgi:hypothetical protein
VVDVQLGDDGRATTIEVQFVLQSEGGDVDGNSCVPERVEATGVADPA